MPEVVVSGMRIAYRRRGIGAPLVLFHGAFEDSRAWADHLDRLSPLADVIAWDAPGCGASDDVPGAWGHTDWADAASGFIAALGLAQPAVAGFSLGSMIALLLARDHPASVGRHVLVGAYAGWGGSLAPDALADRIASARFTIDRPVEEWAEAFLDSVFAPDAAPGTSRPRPHALGRLATRHHRSAAPGDEPRPPARTADRPDTDRRRSWHRRCAESSQRRRGVVRTPPSGRPGGDRRSPARLHRTGARRPARHRSAGSDGNSAPR